MYLLTEQEKGLKLVKLGGENRKTDIKIAIALL